MRYLTLGEVVELHRLVLAVSGGAPGIRDLGALASAVAQPRASFAGTDLHPNLIVKAGALGFALAQGHPFVDGNKRVAHAAMATFLLLNGAGIDAAISGARAAHARPRVGSRDASSTRRLASTTRRDTPA